MHTELAVERYEFTCRHCGVRWASDYDVQHLTTHDGATWQYYSLNGTLVPAPTGEGCVTCPACGATGVYAVGRAGIPAQAGPQDLPWPARELRQSYREGQEDQLGALGLVLNAVVLWNTRYIDAPSWRCGPPATRSPVRTRPGCPRLAMSTSTC